MCPEIGKVVVLSAISGVELGGLIVESQFPETIVGQRTSIGCTRLDQKPEAIVAL